MSDSYIEKEGARAAMVSAICDYKRAAEAYGYDEEDMLGEVESAIEDAEFDDVEVRKS